MKSEKEVQKYEPFVSIVIPCRNEQKFIKGCLDSILSNNYPKDKLEIIIADGMSDDGTKEALAGYAKSDLSIKIVENKQKYTPFALNIAIKLAKGDVIMRMDAHAKYSHDYIKKCVEYLYKYNADSVGGIWRIVSQEKSYIGCAIVLTQRSFFGVGNARYRYAKGNPVWVDTVPYFCCKREVFERIGLFNEKLIRGQDMEFNLRLRKSGGRILLVPEIVCYYYVRSDLSSFILHNFKNGIWAILPFKYSRIVPVSIRHLVPLFFVLTLNASLLLSIYVTNFRVFFLIIIGIYFLFSLYYSLQITLKKGLGHYIFIMPWLFFFIHLSYGLGSVVGLAYLKLPENK